MAKQLPALMIRETFYCVELNKVIHQGRLENLPQDEYDLFLPWADVVGQVDEEIALKDMTVKNLREIAAELKVANYANLKKADLIEQIEDAQAGDGEAELEEEEPEEQEPVAGDSVDAQAENITVE